MIHLLRRFAAILAVMIPAGMLMPPGLGAQGNGQVQLYATVQDTLHVLRVMNGDTVPTSWFAASYRYEMAYDSMSHTNYLFTECSRNGVPVKLRHWKYGRMASGDAAYLTFNSRTFDFPVVVGDTIRFYREMMWYNPVDHRQDTNNYFALDTLDFTVHLVRKSDGEPIALLDSIGILSSLVPGTPAIYGTRPLMAIVEHRIAAPVAGDSVFIGITVRARGDGPNEFTRVDGLTIGVSRRLQSPHYQEYLSIYSTAPDKRTIEDLARAHSPTDANLAVTMEPGSPGMISITFSDARTGGHTAVAIYDATGRLVFYPYSARSNGTRRRPGRTPGEEHRVTYRFESAGAYFVTLLHNGHTVRTEKIIITP